MRQYKSPYQRARTLPHQFACQPFAVVCQLTLLAALVTGCSDESVERAEEEYSRLQTTYYWDVREAAARHLSSIESEEAGRGITSSSDLGQSLLSARLRLRELQDFLLQRTPESVVATFRPVGSKQSGFAMPVKRTKPFVTSAWQQAVERGRRLGNGQLSWRVQLLPDLGYEELYSQFHHDEPWDSPHNLKLLSQMPDVYEPADYTIPKGYTTLQCPALGERKEPVAYLPGGKYRVMLMWVNAELAVPWTCPHDTNLQLLSDEALANAFYTGADGMIRVVTADLGYDEHSAADLSPQDLRVWLGHEKGIVTWGRHR